MSRTIVVTDDQVANARALIRIAGGADKVDPLIRKIAAAEPRTEPGTEPARRAS